MKRTQWVDKPGGPQSNRAQTPWDMHQGQQQKRRAAEAAAPAATASTAAATTSAEMGRKERFLQPDGCQGRHAHKHWANSDRKRRWRIKQEA